MISYNEAILRIQEEFNKIELLSETIPLESASLRTLAEDVYADINLPPFDNSAVDGIALKFTDNVREWELIGEISAGNYNEFELTKNSAVSIMTGSKIPDFCDSIIPVEDIEINGNYAVLKSDAKIKRGMNIRRLGSDITKDKLAVAKGTLLKSRHLSSLASCGKNRIKVYKKLQIAILATGDELIEVDQVPEDDKIRVSNIFSLCGIIEELHQIPLNLGFVGDDRNDLKQVLKQTLDSEIDILVTTGGVSVGKYDYVKDLFKELAVEEVFWRAYIKPGKPAFFGRYISKDKFKLVFGLPGNPVSSLVNFELYLKPFIMQLYGLGGVETVNAVLENDLRKNDKKRHFMKAFLTRNEDNSYSVVSQLSQSSGNLVEFSKANCLIEIEEERLNPHKGEMVKCIMM